MPPWRSSLVALDGVLCSPAYDLVATGLPRTRRFGGWQRPRWHTRRRGTRIAGIANLVFGENGFLTLRQCSIARTRKGRDTRVANLVAEQRQLREQRQGPTGERSREGLNANVANLVVGEVERLKICQCPAGKCTRK